MPVQLSVNVNKFALLRNARGNDMPNVRAIARRCIAAGAHGITVHPRPDERHITRADARELGEWCAGMDSVEFNIEGNPTPEFLHLVTGIRPDQCTLVPDDPAQLTSDHGFDLLAGGAGVAAAVAELKQAGIRVSIFMDPDIDQISRVPQTGADRIELYTEMYAASRGTARQEEVLQRYRAAAEHAHSLGLGCNAGHDLNLHNVTALLEAIPQIHEVSIGHALVVEAFDTGLEETIRRYLAALGY